MTRARIGSRSGRVGHVAGRARARIAAVLVALAFTPALACKTKSTDGAPSQDAPTVVVRDGSEGLLLTWIDDKGDFHVEQKVTEVPLAGRDVVRVVDPSKEDGTHGDRVFLADLRTAQPDGTYKVRVATRAEFDKIAEDRRAAHGTTLAAAEEAGVAANGARGRDNGPPIDMDPGAGPNGALADPNPNARPVVVIYGAEWCGPCHQAQAYLRGKGVPFVEKDVEQDQGAAREMRTKLAHAGMRTGSIPVIDVRGKILVGFSPKAIDDALGAAL